MNLPGFKRVTILSSIEPKELARQLLQLINNIGESVNRLLANPDASSTVQDVELVAATPKLVSHRLELKEGQTPSGWLVTDIDANTTVRRNDWDHRTITIQAANNCNIRLKVW